MNTAQTSAPGLEAAAGLIIELTGVTENTKPIAALDNRAFLEGALGGALNVHYLSRNTIAVPGGFPRPTASLMIQSLHGAFDKHYAFAVSPELVWYAIMHEVAVYVKNNPDKCASYFTSKPGEKQRIQVRDDSLIYGGQNDWAGTIGLFNKPLRDHIAPSVLDVFLPRISTMSIEDETAIMVTFMDTISNYYEYRVATLCGIPRVRLSGTKGDWEMIGQRLDTLKSMFPDLTGYFVDLMGVVRQITRTVAMGRGDQEFWSSIYKLRHQSGGSTITGWITALFAHTFSHDGKHEMRNEFDWETQHSRGWGVIKPNSFPSHISRVPFIWNYHGTEHPMAFIAGVMGVEHQSGFVTPKLGFGVLETA